MNIDTIDDKKMYSIEGRVTSFEITFVPDPPMLERTFDMRTEAKAAGEYYMNVRDSVEKGIFQEVCVANPLPNIVVISYRGNPIDTDSTPVL